MTLLCSYPDHFEYVKEFLGERDGVWKTKDKAVRILNAADESILEIKEFAILGRTITDRMKSRLEKPHPFVFYVLDDQRRNAFAIVPAQCSCVLVTTGVIERLSAIGGQIPMNAARALAFPSDRGSYLKSILEGRQAEENLEAFAGLITHAAFVFLVHHELAHLVLGHEGQWKRHGAVAATEAEHGESVVYFSEDIYASSASAGDGGSHRNQALEMDADVHALYYTRNYLNEQLIKLRIAAVGASLEHFDVLWLSVLDSPIGMGYVLAAAPLLALLSLVPGNQARNTESLGESTHPHVSVRVLAAIRTHFVGSSELDGESIGAISSEAIAFVLALIGTLRLSTHAIELLQRGEKVTEDILSEVTAEHIYESYGLNIAGNELDKLDRHIDELGNDLRSYAKTMSHYARARADDRHQWYFKS